jgi:Domain of unknown function (DUF305)
MTAQRQLPEGTDSQRSNIVGFLEKTPLRTWRFVRQRTTFLTLVAAVIGLVTVAGASLLVRNRGAQAIGGLCTTTVFGNTSEAAFLAENAAAMKKMMNDMDVKPTGNVDLDFVAMMVPHHQGAIDMAMALLRHGRNPQLKRMAQEIIITQQQEIAAMQLAIGQPLPFAAHQASQLSPGQNRAQ